MENHELILRCKSIIDKKTLFEKCVVQFWISINEYQDKSVLEDIKCSPEKLQIIEHSISLEFSPYLEDIYFIETKIIFASEDLTPLGHFRWVETNLDEFIDDFFVVY
jgi:hypothetical protein